MSNKTVIVRDARPEDIDGLIRLLEQLFSIEKDFTVDADKHRRGLALMLDGCGKHRAVKLAEHQGRIVGMCTAQTRISTARGDTGAVLEDLVVDESCRGEGIGKMLLVAMADWADKRGIRLLQLLADRDNTPALLFYQAQNWQQTNLICLTRDIRKA